MIQCKGLLVLFEQVLGILIVRNIARSAQQRRPPNRRHPLHVTEARQ